MYRELGVPRGQAGRIPCSAQPGHLAGLGELADGCVLDLATVPRPPANPQGALPIDEKMLDCCCCCRSVGVDGQCVGRGGGEARAAEQFGHGDKVDPAAKELGGEGVRQYVRPERVRNPGIITNGGDDRSGRPGQ